MPMGWDRFVASVPAAAIAGVQGRMDRRVKKQEQACQNL